MDHSAEIVIVTVLGLSLLALLIFGVVSFCRPKKPEGNLMSWKEYKEKTKKP